MTSAMAASGFRPFGLPKLDLESLNSCSGNQPLTAPCACVRGAVFLNLKFGYSIARILLMQRRLRFALAVRRSFPLIGICKLMGMQSV